MKKPALLFAVSVLCPFLSARAADWFTLKDFGPVSARLAVTIENPADVPVAAADVHIRLDELRKSLPDAKSDQVCVVDPAAKPAGHDTPNLNFVPSQVSDDTLIFAVPLKAHEKKQLFVYTAPQSLNMPGFPAQTAYDSRHAYRSFENWYAAFKIETGPGANTTGMAIDLFGKTKAGDGLRLVELFQATNYHKLTYWGCDILKVGSGPGDGGIYLFAGDQIGRAPNATTFVQPIYIGPVETKIKVSSPVEVAGKTYNVTRYITLIGQDRSLHDETIVRGDGVESLQIGIGIRDLPNCVWVEHPGDKGYGFQTGDNNQPGYKAVGMGCAFDPQTYLRTYDLPDKNNGGHVYVLKGHLENGSLVSRHRIADIWDADGQLAHPVDKPEELRAPFQSWFESYAEQRDHPIKVELAAEGEKK